MKVGSVIGHYHIVKSLGGGGMGAVYVANDTRLNRKVALKTLPARMANDPQWIRRFEREAQAVAALNHPNIVTIHSVEEADDVHFIILEYVGGKTLEKLIPDGGLSIDMFFDVAIPLSDALAAAHKRGIAHRDLKPSNVMLSDEGHVKVLDFGIAKLVEGLVTDDEAATAVGSEALTQEGKIVGTVAYMSPEQAEGKGADHRSDIFSLGIILYEMATGDRPFKGDTNLSILASIVKDQPTLIVERNVEMPRHLARIVKKALEKDLDRRYTSMVELRNDLIELKEEIDAGRGAGDRAGHRRNGGARRCRGFRKRRRVEDGGDGGGSGGDCGDRLEPHRGRRRRRCRGASERHLATTHLDTRRRLRRHDLSRRRVVCIYTAHGRGHGRLLAERRQPHGDSDPQRRRLASVLPRRDADRFQRSPTGWRRQRRIRRIRWHIDHGSPRGRRA